MYFSPDHLPRRLLAICLALAIATPALAWQDTAEDQGGVESSTVVYEAEYFARYNVISATDMLRRIPGASAILDARRGQGGGQEVRGFGSGGDQILINGERIAGKANQIDQALERIQASRVLRIELIRGTSAELDVRSEGLIINIVLNGELTGGAGSWSAEGQYIEGGHFRPKASISYSGDKGRLNYFVGLETGNFFRRQLADDNFFSPVDGRQFERRDEEKITRFRRYRLTTNLNYRFARGDELRVNGLVEYSRFTETEISDQFTVDPMGIESFLQTEPLRMVSKGLKWEIGADYERRMGKSGRLKILFVHTDDNGDKGEKQRRILDGFDFLTNIEATDEIKRETILRPSFKWDLTKSQNIEIGVEGALNSLDTFLEVLEDQDGELVIVDIFNADAKVEEIRVEGFSTHVWRATSRFTLESALNAEYSRLDQSGSDIQETRSFFFLKPRFDLRFDVTKSKQVRLKVERTISQLNFADFVSTFDEEDDRPDSGNPDLVQEKTWIYEAAYEQRLANDGGFFKVKLFYNDISDKIDKVIGNIGGDRSATGNVGDASLYGAEVESSVRLAMVGVPDAVVTVSYTRQRARLTDFFTGERHGFNRTADFIWKIGLRHDTQTRFSLSYGFDIRREGGRPTNDIDDYWIFTTKPEVNAFAEVKILGGLTLRLQSNRLAHDVGERDRIRFVGNKARGEVSRTEYRRRILSRTFALSLRGNF